MHFLKAINFFKSDKFVYIILSVLCFSLYVNVLSGPFLWDDVLLVEQNETITSFRYFVDWFTSPVFEVDGVPRSNFYRPISNVLYALVYQLFGLNPVGYHLLNVILHILSGCLIFSIFRKMKLDKVVSAVMAVIFLMHPLQTESVSYIAGLPDISSVFFVLLGCDLYLRKLKKRPVLKFLSMTVVFVLGLLSKEGAVVFPAILALLTFFMWCDYSSMEKRSHLRYVFFSFFLVVVYIVLRFTVLDFTGTTSLLAASGEYSEKLYVRLITFISVLWEYFVMIFFPENLHFEKAYIYFPHLFTLRGLFGSFFILIGLVFSVLSFGRSKIFLSGFLWFFAALSPVSGLTVPNTPYAAHFLYLPMVGVLLMAYPLLLFVYRRKFLWSFVVISLVALSWRTVGRNSQYADPVKFYANELNYTLNSERLYNQAGGLLLQMERYEAALDMFSKGLEVSGGLYSDNTWYNMGITLIELKRFDEAALAFIEALKIGPNNLKYHQILYDVFHRAGQEERAKVFEEYIGRIESGGSVTVEEISNFK